jgi:hypothetical protein
MHKIHRRLTMKKFFALLLVVLMLVPFIMACDPDDTDTNSATQNTNTDTSKPSNTDTDTDTGTGNLPPVDNKKDVDAEMQNYKGSTVNVMAATWSNGEAGAPWSQVELCVTDWDLNANGYGTVINNAVMERKEYIEDTYEVTVNWINCGGSSMLNQRTQAAMNKGQVGEEIIHVAMPHVFEAMQIVVDDAVYSMGSDYINFDADYFSQESVEQYTLAGNTFFAGGDISFLDEQTAHLIFYNMAIAKENQAFPDLYEYALNGTWTIDTLYTLASAVSYNADGIDGYSDNDKYGLGTRGLSAFYQYFGVYQVSKKDSVDGEIYYLSVRDDKVSTIIDQMIKAKKNESYIRTDWDGDYVAMQAAFEDNRLLFYHEVIQKLDYLGKKPDLQVGILPFPKLNVQQERYYSPSASQSTLICIPRATDDRDMSEAFVEILSSSASRYVMPAYYDMVESNLYAEFAEQSMRVLKEQIFPNMMYDQGYMFEYGGLVTGSIQQSSIEGNVNNFESAYANGYGAAEDKLIEWNTAYGSYSDEI